MLFIRLYWSLSLLYMLESKLFPLPPQGSLLEQGFSNSLYIQLLSRESVKMSILILNGVR